MWIVFGFCTAAMTPIISLCLASLAEGPTVSSSTTQSEQKLRSQVSITTLRTCQHLTIKCSNSRVVKHSIIQSCGLDMCKSPEWEDCDTWVIMQLFMSWNFQLKQQKSNNEDSSMFTASNAILSFAKNTLAMMLHK